MTVELKVLAGAVLACSLSVLACAGLAQTRDGEASGNAAAASSGAAPGDDERVPEFSEAMLDDPDRVATGKALWEDTCRHCHGRSAYPGKAPKLRPRRYTPEFVYDRVTNGFRQMPPWKDVLSDEERVSIVAYVLSDRFSP